MVIFYRSKYTRREFPHFDDSYSRDQATIHRATLFPSSCQNMECKLIRSSDQMKLQYHPQ